MRGKFRALINLRFGSLVVTEEIERGPRRRVTAQCDCGTVKSFEASSLVSGNTSSCGCGCGFKVKHGLAKTPEYKAWCAMIRRCTNPAVHNYHRYGGRGIRVCDRWRKSVEAFVLDMGPRPKGFTLERIDGDGNYEPGNCRWADKREQANNRHTNRTLELNGVRKTMAEWSRELGIPRETIKSRLSRGADPAEALTRK